jgi:hypothetical protein
MTHSSTTRNSPSTNVRTLHRRNNKGSMYQVGKSRFSKTSKPPIHLHITLILIHNPHTRTPKKPKSKRPGPSAKTDAAAAAAAGPSNLSGFKREGTKDSPIALGSDDEDAKPGQKRKRYTTVVENGKKRRVVNIVRAPSSPPGPFGGSN